MPVTFDKIKVGSKYERPELAETWGYAGFQAISRGVVTPAKTSFIILFVTKQKQQALTQYNDYITGDQLHWEGEEKHSSDNRIINAKAAKDQIHLFYRDIHHTPFEYYGQLDLIEYSVNKHAPSEFVFSIRKEQPPLDILSDIESKKDEYKQLENTERESIVKSRIGQGDFREKVIDLWKSCAVSGLTNIALLRASHIKPWRDSSNFERLDPMNGLLLQPTLDHLFDKGLITFDNTGQVIISSELTKDEINCLNLDSEMRLRFICDKTKDYLHYHRQHVFNG